MSSHAVATALALCICARSFSALSAPTPPPVAVVEQPRATGYFVGDLIAQRILLERVGYRVTPAKLRTPGRVNAWFERRSVSVEKDTSSRRWLVVRYQIINAPSKLVTVTLPAWTLPVSSSLAVPHRAIGSVNSTSIRSTTGVVVASPATAAAKTGAVTASLATDAGITGVASASPDAATTSGLIADAHGPAARHSGLLLTIPAVSINIAPLSPPGSPTQVGAADLRPDHLPPTIATAPIRRALTLSSGGMALTLFSWLCWIAWRNRRAIATGPFSRALREMRSLDDQEPRTWQALHRAFDRTAGRVIQKATLPTLFDRAPQLLPMRTQIEEFLAASNQLFFAAPAASGSATAPAAPAASESAIAPAAPAASTSAAAPAASGSSTSAIAPAAPGVPTAPNSNKRSDASLRPDSTDATARPRSITLSPRALCADLVRIERRFER